MKGSALSKQLSWVGQRKEEEPLSEVKIKRRKLFWCNLNMIRRKLAKSYLPLAGTR